MVSDVNMSHIHQLGLKAYYCKGSICMIDSCMKGKEIKDIFSEGLHYKDIIIKELVPLPESHVLLYQDGSKEVINTPGIIRGCDGKECVND